ncbi:hypothetical protein BDN67DRAFT_969778 [Paxillus ammoniavirescens]|nr:hypothetical protein BDN67DRAFT_969778 [Paxillus ammoniavirescens]
MMLPMCASEQYTSEQTPVPSEPEVELLADVWFIIMSHLSPFDLVNLSQTCRTLHEYSQLHHVWHNALLNHRFLPKSYPHLRNASTDIIRRQLITTARIDKAYSQSSLKPNKSYSFPIDVPGQLLGLRFLPGGKWLVLLFHSRTLNPACHSNICLFKPPLASSPSDSTPTSVTLQSEWCWLSFSSLDGPYKSSRGDDLMLLRTFVKNKRTFAICHLDTKTPSLKITYMFHTTVFIRNYTVAGDYIAYGWITDDRKHMLRVMKLSDDYTTLVKDVTVEIDCPPGHDGKLRIHYDLRFSGKTPRVLLISTRLMAAYDISDMTSTSESLPLRIRPVWKHMPTEISFGRILQMFHEGAIVTLYEGKIRFIYPEIDNAKPNSQTVAIYRFPHPKPQSSKWPACFESQRIFWLLRLPGPLPAAASSRPMIETATLPSPHGEDCDVERVLVDHEDLTSTSGCSVCVTSIVQDWDELSGRLCVRHGKSKFPQDHSWRKLSWHITIMDMV